jgi:hypothetical protein
MVIGNFDFSKIETDVFSVIFLIIYFFFMIFFMFNIITVIYIDEYRMTYMDDGKDLYPDWSWKDRL